MKPIIFTLTGPTCAGKSTLEKMMVRDLDFANLVSDTTRQPRVGDVHGINYYFNTHEGFKAKKDNGELIEAVEFNGEHYGLSIAEVNRVTELGKPIVVVVEPGGRQQIQAYCKKHKIICKSIFVTADTYVIAERFITRILEDSRAIPPSGLKKFTKASAVRLQGMMNHERYWVEEDIFDSKQRAFVSPYHYIVHEFGEYTTDDVLQYIDNMLKAIHLQAA